MDAAFQREHLLTLQSDKRISGLGSGGSRSRPTLENQSSSYPCHTPFR